METKSWCGLDQEQQQQQKPKQRQHSSGLLRGVATRGEGVVTVQSYSIGPSECVLKPLGSNSSINTARSVPGVLAADRSRSESGSTAEKKTSRAASKSSTTSGDQGQSQRYSSSPRPHGDIPARSGYRTHSGSSSDPAIIIANREAINSGSDLDTSPSVVTLTRLNRPEALCSEGGSRGGEGKQTGGHVDNSVVISKDTKEVKHRPPRPRGRSMTTVPTCLVSLPPTKYGTIHTSSPSTYLDTHGKHSADMILSPSGSEVGILAMDSDSVTSSRTSTPTNVRTRPRLPMELVRQKDILVAAATAAFKTGALSPTNSVTSSVGNEDIVCDFDTLGRTDFVRKFSKKVSRGESPGGISVSSTPPRSVPTTPIGMIIIPGEDQDRDKTSRPHTIGGLAPQRSRSVKLKLEKIREARRTSDLSLNDPRRTDPTALASLVKKDLGIDYSRKSSSSSGDPESRKTSTESSTLSDKPPSKGKENNVPENPQLHKLQPCPSKKTSDVSLHHPTLTSHPRSLSPKEYSPSPSDLEVRETLSKTVASDRRIWDDTSIRVTATDARSQRPMCSVGVQSPPFISSAPVIATSVTEEGHQDPNLDIYKSGVQSADKVVKVTRPSAVHWKIDSKDSVRKDKKESSTEKAARRISDVVEDEGVGEIDEEPSVSPFQSDGCYTAKTVSKVHWKNTPVTWATPETKRKVVLDSIQDTNAQQNVDNSDMSGTGKLPNGRFLTHPPSTSKERGNITESGFKDSNGFGVLKDSSSLSHVPQNTSEITPQLSATSLDSHICGEEDYPPTYHDVVQDVTAEATDVNKLERKNSKTFKQKSKSDPSGEKQKESLRLQPNLQVHVQSSPVLSNEPQETSLDELEGSLLSPGARQKQTSVSDSSLARLGQSSKQVDEPTSEPKPEPTSPTETAYMIKAQRSSSRKRNNRLARESKETQEAEDQPNVKLRQGAKGNKPRPVAKFIESEKLEPRSPESPSPENTLEKHKHSSLKPSSSSLTLPFSKKSSALTRSHSSASVFLSKVDQYRNTTPSPGSSRQKDASKRRPGFTDSLSTSPGGTLDSRRGDKGWASSTASGYLPSLEPILAQSSLSLFEGAAEEKEKRDLIVQEFYSTEELYVEALQMLVERYMIPMKTQGVVDSSLVDDIFYKVNEIYMHHATFLTFLGKALTDWNSQTSTIGDIIHRNFSKQTVIESYVSFIEHFPRAEKVLDEISAKSSFQKFNNVCERENRMRLPLKANIVKPAQRIPRYELLLKRLLDNTPTSHPDHMLLEAAEKSIHQLALQINSVKESRQEEDYQETLKKLELILITDLAAVDRTYIRHDMVQIMNRKDQCCIWLFSDLAVFSSVKRKSGPVNRKTTLLLQSPTGNDYVENNKHKLWLKISLEDLEIVKVETSPDKLPLVDKDILESDVQLLGQISYLTEKLNCDHLNLEDTLKDLVHQVNKQLAEHQRKSPPPEANRVELLANTTEGLEQLILVFPSPDKKLSWEGAFMSAKQKLAALAEGKPPEFSQALPITKTRAGMQFSCASPIEGYNDKNFRDIWVCNSDGYVGHMCLLSLQPDPIVTLNTPVPGCNSRILCICAVPVLYGMHKRKLSRRKIGVSHAPPPQILVHEVKSDKSKKKGRVRQKSTSDKHPKAPWEDDLSSSCDSADSESSESSQEGEEEEETRVRKESTGSSSSRVRQLLSLSRSSPSESPSKTLDPQKSTMWLGTDDGCILVFPSNENVKTTKSKIKLQQNASVLCVCYLEYKVFAGLANGDLIVYKNNTDGSWDLTSPATMTLGSGSAPVNRMLSVAGRLWCACHQDIYVVNPDTLEVEVSFCGDPETKKPIQCMATSGHGVWLVAHGSGKVALFHAISHQLLTHVSVTQAVAQKLQTADDIIRQHKMACLRITALLCCKDQLWIGTSAGVILTFPMPKISQATSRNSIAVGNVTGLLHGHTGHVRFLTCVDVSAQPRRRTGGTSLDPGTPGSDGSPASWHSRRMSLGVHSFSIAAKMLVISGGDGYEDFSPNAPAEPTGRDDSTNHLLTWHV